MTSVRESRELQPHLQVTSSSIDGVFLSTLNVRRTVREEPAERLRRHRCRCAR